MPFGQLNILPGANLPLPSSGDLLDILPDVSIGGTSLRDIAGGFLRNTTIGGERVFDGGGNTPGVRNTPSAGLALAPGQDFIDTGFTPAAVEAAASGGGGMPFGQSLQAAADAFSGGLPGVDIVSERNTVAARFFAPTRGGARARSTVMVPNPVSGEPTFFKHAGRCILWSGDLSAAKRVRRVAARAKRGR